jgi:hypothetical protein
MSSTAPRFPSYGNHCLLAALQKNKCNNTVTELSQISLPSVGNETPVLAELQPLAQIPTETFDELIPLDQQLEAHFNLPLSDNDCLSALGDLGDYDDAFPEQIVNQNFPESDIEEVEKTAEEFIAQNFNDDVALHVNESSNAHAEQMPSEMGNADTSQINEGVPLNTRKRSQKAQDSRT